MMPADLAESDDSPRRDDGERVAEPRHDGRRDGDDARQQDGTEQDDLAAEPARQEASEQLTDDVPVEEGGQDDGLRVCVPVELAQLRGKESKDTSLSAEPVSTRISH